jgi:thiol reductant ABC exporter CydD subunit
MVVAVAIGLALTVCVVVQAVLVADIVDRAFLHGADLAGVTPQLVGLGAAFAARAVLVWGGEVTAQRTSATVTSLLRRRLLHHALALGPSWLAGERAGELSLSAGRGITALNVYFGRYLPQAVLAALAPLAILVWVAVVDWPSALILAGMLLLVPVSLAYFGREATARTTRQWRRLSSLSARFLELIQGLPTLRAFGRAGHGRKEVAAATEGLRQATMATLRISFLSALAIELLSGLGVGLVAMVLGLRLLNGSLPLTTALAVLLVAPEVFLPVRRAGAEFHASTEGQAAAQRIMDVLDVPVPEPAGAAAAPGAPDPTSPPDPSRSALRVQRLTVRYEGRSDPALENFDLTIEPGEHVALIGPSGSGKSTLLWALLGFVPVCGGSVSVGPVDLATCPAVQWRRCISWVPQRPHLFSGTLEDNVRIGDPGATPDAVRRAVAAAGLSEFVSQLPAGLSTTVGEGGLTLSAGERQRFAIARAVLRDAPLVLLDEPVAHLDATAEAQLRDELAPWLASRSVLVAAHRPELVGHIDRVVRLEAARWSGAEDDLDPATPADPGAPGAGVGRPAGAPR